MIIPSSVPGLRSFFGNILIPGTSSFHRGSHPECDHAKRFEDETDGWRRDDLLKPGICEVCEYEGMVQFGVCSEDCRDIEHHRWFGWQDSYNCTSCGKHQECKPIRSHARWMCDGFEFRGYCSEACLKRSKSITCPRDRKHRTGQDCLMARAAHYVKGFPGQGAVRPSMMPQVGVA